jgi:hypothetical protein
MGRRRNGVPLKIVSLLSQCRDMFGSAYLFSPTLFGTGVMGTIFKNAPCYRQPTEAILRAIQTTQDYLMERRPSFLDPKDLTCLVVLDDCGSLPFAHSKYFEELVCSCRRSNMALWLTYQHANQMIPAVIEKLDVLTVDLTTNVKTKEKLFTNFFSCFGTLEKFDAALKHCAQTFGSIVWRRNAGEYEDIAHSVFRFRYSNIDVNSFSLRLPLQSLADPAQMQVLTKLGSLYGTVRDHARTLEEQQREVKLTYAKLCQMEKEEKQQPAEELTIDLSSEDCNKVVENLPGEEDEDGFVLVDSSDEA